MLENQIIKQTLEMEQNDKSRQKKTNPPGSVSGVRAKGGQKKAGINLQEFEYMERGEKEEEKRQHQEKESGFKINIINFHNEFNI